MTTAIQIIFDIAALGGAVGFLAVVAGQMRRLMSRIEEILALPNGQAELRREVSELRQSTTDNTAAIVKLTAGLDALRQVEQRKANGAGLEIQVL